MDYRIVTAEPEHCPLFPEIEHRCAQVFAEEDLPEPLRSTPNPEAIFRDAQANGLLWAVVHQTNIPVGFLLAELVDGNFHIKEMDIHPAHARKGLGGSLLEHVFNIARERDFSHITLTTFKHLPWNKRFYQKYEFNSLNDSEMGVELREILRQEEAAGLRNRVAMRREITT